ncbi:hypothetical protein D3C75_725030 [compost metagenome]
MLLATPALPSAFASTEFLVSKLMVLAAAEIGVVVSLEPTLILACPPVDATDAIPKLLKIRIEL